MEVAFFLYFTPLFLCGINTGAVHAGRQSETLLRDRGDGVVALSVGFLD